MKKLIERYADFVAKKPHVILIIVVILTLISFVGMSLVKTEGMSYKDMLPENVEEIDAINYIADEFGTSGESAIIILRTNPNYVGSNEIRDIRDPRVVEYSDILEQKIRGMEDVVSVTGFSDILKTMNSGHLPKTKAKIIELMNKKIVINQSSFNLPEVLSQFSEGLEGIEEGMKGEEQIIEGLTYGLNGSSIALKQIQYTLLAIAEGMNQEENLTQINQTISLIDQIEFLVNQSNATNMSMIIGSLEGLKNGMNEMIAQASEAQEGMLHLSMSLNGMANAIGEVSSGLEKMKNTSLILGNLTSNLRDGISEMSSGLDEINKYIELYEGKQKKEKPISLNQFKYYVSKDYTTTIIRINLGEMNDEKRKNFVEELKYIIDETEKPAGLNVGITGGPVVSLELRKQIMPTMQKTSMFSLIGIFIIVSLLFLSIRRGIISLLAIGFGIIWVYGTLGILGLPISSTMSGGISMIMGIGIDFGIQVVNRFRQERKKNKVEKAIKITLSNVFTPMLITTLAALIGFRAMSLGQLTLLSDLGNMMSLGVLFCFIAAVTVIPAILVISEKLQYRRKRFRK